MVADDLKTKTVPPLDKRERLILTVVLSLLVVFVLILVLCYTSHPPAGSTRNAPVQDEPGGKQVPEPTTQAATKPGVRPPLPADYSPPATGAPMLGRVLDRRLRADQRIPPDITTRIPRLTSEKDVQAVLGMLRDRGDDLVARNEAMNLLRRSAYKPQLPEELVRLMKDPAETDRFRSYCLQGMMTCAMGEPDASKARVTELIEPYLAAPTVEVRRSALRALTLLDHPKALELALVAYLNEKEDPEIRVASIHTIGHFKKADAIPQLREVAAKEKNADIRVAVIAVLGQFKDEGSRALFEAAMKANSSGVRTAGKAALKQLAPVPETGTK